MKKIILFLFGLCLSGDLFAQEADTLPYTKFNKHHLVLYTDLGFNTAPFSLSYPFTSEIKKLKYRNNFNAVVGFGFAYRWLSLRFGVTLPNTLRQRNKYGKTKYYDLGFDFTFRNMFFDFDGHLYDGYAIKEAYKWIDTLNSNNPNLIRDDVNAISISINAWQFFNNHFKMVAFRGKTALYNKDIRSFYLKYTVNYHGITTGSGRSLVPEELIDTTQSKTGSNSISAFDMGIVPGYAYVRRWRIFQMGIIGGVGLVLQSKTYSFSGQNKSLLGLAPRVDVKIMAGINKPKYFIMFIGDFNNKSIAFNDFTYQQTFYSLKLYGGVRFDVRNKKKKLEDQK